MDERRAVDGIEELDDPDIADVADQIVGYACRAHETYRPFSFWDELDTYIELAVEKIDLKSLFAPIAAEFHVPLTNIAGWADINGRAAMMRRFSNREREGKRCILLYCGDHDPGGLAISGFLRSNMADLERAVGWSPDNLHIDRFGLNADFITAHGLTWIDNLETAGGGRLDDPRHPDHRKPYVQTYLARFGAKKLEANALVVRPEAGRNLCRQAIERYLPEEALEHYESRLAVVRDELGTVVFSRLGGSR